MQSEIDKASAYSAYKDPSQKFLMRKSSNNILNYKNNLVTINREKSPTTSTATQSNTLRKASDPILIKNLLEFAFSKKEFENIARKFTLNDLNENKEKNNLYYDTLKKHYKQDSESNFLTKQKSKENFKIANNLKNSKQKIKP